MTPIAPGSFQSAVESGDAEAIRTSLSAGAVFNSPVVFAPYRGREAVVTVLAAALEVLHGLRSTDLVVDDDHQVLVFEARVADRRVQGVVILRLDGEGLVDELTVMLRPMTGLIAMAEAIRQRLGSV
jgi:hypothetical protein